MWHRLQYFRRKYKSEQKDKGSQCRFLWIFVKSCCSWITDLTLCSPDAAQAVPNRYTRWLSSPRSLLDDTCTCYARTPVESSSVCQPRSRTARHPPLKRNTLPTGQRRSSDRTCERMTENQCHHLFRPVFRVSDHANNIGKPVPVCHSNYAV